MSGRCWRWTSARRDAGRRWTGARCWRERARPGWRRPTGWRWRRRRSSRRRARCCGAGVTWRGVAAAGALAAPDAARPAGGTAVRRACRRRARRGGQRRGGGPCRRAGRRARGGAGGRHRRGGGRGRAGGDARTSTAPGRGWATTAAARGSAARPAGRGAGVRTGAGRRPAAAAAGGAARAVGGRRIEARPPAELRARRAARRAGGGRRGGRGCWTGRWHALADTVRAAGAAPPLRRWWAGWRRAAGGTCSVSWVTLRCAAAGTALDGARRLAATAPRSSSAGWRAPCRTGGATPGRVGDRGGPARAGGDGPVRRPARSCGTRWRRSAARRTRWRAPRRPWRRRRTRWRRACGRAGRLFTLGAGTPGRLAALDAAELGPTFNAPPGLVVPVLAGGPAAMLRAAEGAEDDRTRPRRPRWTRTGWARRTAWWASARPAAPRSCWAVCAMRGRRGALSVAVVNNAGQPAPRRLTWRWRS